LSTYYPLLHLGFLEHYKGFSMRLIGLTGSIAMGKSTLAKQFRRWHIPVFSADDKIAELYKPKGEGAKQLCAFWPQIISQEGGVDRQKLTQLLLENPHYWPKLETITHRLLTLERQKTYRRWHRQRVKVAVVDLPLLFEKYLHKELDIICLALAPQRLQYWRVMQRARMSEEKFVAIKKRQMPDSYKKRLTDKIIITGLGYSVAVKDLKNFYLSIIKNPYKNNSYNNKRIQKILTIYNFFKNKR
jgi:dephospho-CoA kinase